METINLTIGANLKKLRDLFCYTQDGVAKKAGIERSAYSNYEAGLREAPYDVLEKLAQIFDCETYTLFDENLSEKKDVLACAFRMEDISDEDFQKVCNFKDVVRNYLKMNRIING